MVAVFVSAVKKTKYIESDESEKFSTDEEKDMETNKGAGISDDSDFAPAASPVNHEDKVKSVDLIR